MSDQTDALLAELLATQKRLLALEEEVLANQKIGVERQRRALIWFIPLLFLILLSPYLPWLIARFLTR